MKPRVLHTQKPRRSAFLDTEIEEMLQSMESEKGDSESDVSSQGGKQQCGRRFATIQQQP